MCRVCHVEEGSDINLLTCGGCKSVAYCSKEHQKEDWKSHKNKCTPFAITSDPVLGRQWVATQNLKAGALISEEFSVLYCPQWEAEEMVCLTCGLILNPDRPQMCTKCKWPICSPECEKHPVHAENECKIFTNQNIHFNPFAFSDLQDLIRLEYWEEALFFANPVVFSVEILRSLGLKERQPDVFAELLREAYRPAIYFKDSVSRQVNQLRFFKKLVNLQKLGLSEEEKDESELAQFIEASCGNKFTCPFEDFLVPKKATMEGTFIKSTLLNHSCAPNCQRITRPFPHFATRIRTMVPVKKGDRLTINYFREGLELEGRDLRKKEIWRYWRFHCQCSKCMDPSELGSFGDGIGCDKCRGGNETKSINFGYFLPQHSSADDEESKKDGPKWKCNGCKLSISPSIICKRLQLQETEYKDAKLSEKLLQTFVQEKSGKILHPNHHLILTACRELVQLTEASGQQWKDAETFHKWREASLRIFTIENALVSGISPARGITRSRFAAGLLTAVKNDFFNFTEKENVSLIQESLKYLEEALIPFQYDVEVVPSYKSKVRAIKSIKEKGREMLKLFV